MSSAEADQQQSGGARLQKIVMAVVLGVFALTMLGVLLIPTQRPVGSNGVLTAKYLATVTAQSGPLCVKGVTLPADADIVRLSPGTYGQGDVQMKLTAKSADGRTLGASAPPTFGDGKQIDFTVPTAQRSDLTLCFSTSNARVSIPGEPDGKLSVPQVSYLGDRPVPGDIAMQYLPAGKSAAIGSVPKVFERASLFRPSWVGTWTYWLIFPALLGLIGAGWALLLRAGRLTRAPSRRLLIAIAAIAFANAALWALITPAFNTPDELAHFVYVETVASGHLPDKDLSKNDGGNSYRPSTVYASSLTAAAIIGRSVAREPWNKAEEKTFYENYDRLRDGPDKPYGLTPANAYSPAYYIPAALFYKLGSFGNIFDQLFMVRIFSALLLALTVIFAMLFVAEMLPRWRWAAPVAGLTLAFEPMVVHLGGGVSNDYLMLPACTAALWLGARLMRRGPTFGNVLMMSIAFAIGLIAKPTSAGLAPALAFAVLVGVWRSEARLRALGASAAAAAVPCLIALGTIKIFGGADTASVTGAHVATNLHPVSFANYLSYLWQWYLPQVGGMTNLFYGEPPAIRAFLRGFLADFNALDTHFPTVVYATFGLAGLALVGLAVRAVWQRRERLAGAWPIVVYPALAVIFMAVLINTTGYLLFSQNGQFFAQGRYFFPALAVFALLIPAAGVGAGRRWSLPVVSASVMALAALNVAGVALSLSRFYL
ncbi:MAG: DUF2142 domain-containing protein [Solirubrobacterales bacterium]